MLNKYDIETLCTIKKIAERENVEIIIGGVKLGCLNKGPTLEQIKKAKECLILNNAVPQLREKDNGII